MPGFPVRGTKQRPLVRLFIEESRMKFFNANKLHRKSEMWATRPGRKAALQGLKPKVFFNRLRPD
jgi:hypothetical protein